MFVTYSAWVSRVLLAIGQLLITRILVQYLGVESYGYLVVILSFATWMSLTDCGFGSVFQNKYSENIVFKHSQADLLNSFKSFQILLSLVWVPILGIFVIFIPSIVKINADAQSSGFTLIIFFSLVGWMITAVMGMTYRILYSMGMGYWSNIYPAIGSIFSVLLLFFFDSTKFNLSYKYVNVLFSMVIPNLAMACFATLKLPGKYELRVLKIFSDIKPLLKPSLGFFLFSLLVALITNLDYIIMSRVLEEDVIAEYNILSKIFTFTYSFFYAALMTYWPIFSEKIYAKNFKYVNLIIKKILLIILSADQ